MKKAFLLALSLCVLVPVASAHHGFGPHFFQDRLIRIEGTIKQFDFINPHSFLYIDSVDDAGEPVVYVCDMQARTQLVRRGVGKDMFKVGEKIVVDGFPARRNPLGCEFGKAYFADGSEFTGRSIDKARTQFAEDVTVPFEDDDNRTIFGTWIRPGMDGDMSGSRPYFGFDSVTAAGQAASDAYDPITERPVLFCEPEGPARQWRPPGLATSIRREGDKVIIYHESMDTTRVVHLDQTRHPADAQRTRMGHSIGRLEDDVLVIETAAFSSGVFTGSNMHTENMTMQERLSLQPDTGRLLIAWTAIDPAYYSEPVGGSQVLQRTNREMIPYECIPGSPLE
jgi:hypothetical protein